MASSPALMNYRLRVLKNGECDVRQYIAFGDLPDGDLRAEETLRFYLYIWLIEGAEGPIIVDTGPRDVESFNRGTQQYIPGGVRQAPEERTPRLLVGASVTPADVSHVLVTHLHPDHYEYFDLFPNARFVVSRQGFCQGLESIRPNVMRALADRWPESLLCVGDEEVLPGIRTVQVGGHSPCSQGIVVSTAEGDAVICGDAAYLYENIESRRPIGWASRDESLAAIRRLRDAGEIWLPGHDPEVLRRHPSGVVG